MSEPDRISRRKDSGFFFYVRRVPQGISELDTRRVIRKSLKTTDPTEAAIKARQIDDALEAYWAALLSGKHPANSLKRYEAAIQIASLRGFTYRSAGDVAELAIGDLMPRIDAAAEALREGRVVEAVLGGAPEAEISLSALWEAYYSRNKAALMGKSPGQLKRHRQQREASAQVAIDVIGDMVLGNITRADTARYRQHWVDRVVAGEVTTASANRSMSDIKGMLTVVDLALTASYGDAWENLRIRDKKQKSKKRKRPAYSDAFIRDEILKPGALDGMNREARCVTYLIIETGLRPSEACNLRPQDIRLDAPIPHLAVDERDDREQKSEQSVRTIPLVGCALWAAKQSPQGFPRYQDNADSFSAAVNKYFRENGLKPTPKHVIYSLRHSFQDRLIAAGAQDRMQTDLMGHELGRPEYGDGAALKQKLKLMKTIAFKWTEPIAESG